MRMRIVWQVATGGSSPGTVAAPGPAMILPDINILIHAHHTESPNHELARQWWDKCLAGPTDADFARFHGLNWTNPLVQPSPP